jgi:hypothetical protein
MDPKLIFFRLESGKLLKAIKLHLICTQGSRSSKKVRGKPNLQLDSYQDPNMKIRISDPGLRKDRVKISFIGKGGGV